MKILTLILFLFCFSVQAADKPQGRCWDMKDYHENLCYPVSGDLCYAMIRLLDIGDTKVWKGVTVNKRTHRACIIPAKYMADLFRLAGFDINRVR